MQHYAGIYTSSPMYYNEYDKGVTCPATNEQGSERDISQAQFKRANPFLKKMFYQDE